MGAHKVSEQKNQVAGHCDRKRMKKPPDALQGWATILSLVAIPTVLGFGQLYLANQDTNRQYVQLAMDILRNPAKNEDGESLRAWAVDVINETAPVELTEKAKTKLIKEGWQPTGWIPDGYQPSGWDSTSFSPQAFDPGAFAMGMRRMTEAECQQLYGGDEELLKRCLAVARDRKQMNRPAP